MNQSISIITVTHNRANCLKEKALSSLLAQTRQDMTWIVINDGGDLKTRDLISNLTPEFKVKYREIERPFNSFGLCKGRNLGFKIATTPLVAYLDDDNFLKPSFVKEMVEFFSSNKTLKFSIPLQNRRREVWQQGKKVKESKEFVSPEVGTGLKELVTHQQLFDSNGLTHYRESAPQWNENYRIYCDYEYFLQCINQWGEEAFEINQRVLVEYIQTNQGIIGQSNLKDWALELGKIIKYNNDYSVLRDNATWLTEITKLSQKYAQKSQGPTAFKVRD